MKTTIALFAFALFSISSIAQQNNCKCCTENHKAFNFWVGNWNVVDTAGKAQGENTIEILENGCVLSEQWKGASGFTGRSYNYYDPSDSTWNQLWLDYSGSILKLKGKARKDKMVLQSEAKQWKNKTYYDRISWTKITDDKVSQLWERVDSTGKSITVVFNGIYLRKKE